MNMSLMIIPTGKPSGCKMKLTVNKMEIAVIGKKQNQNKPTNKNKT